MTRTLSVVIEGIATAEDLAFWDEEDWDQWNFICKNPYRVQDTNNTANLITQVPFKVSVKSLKRLNIASKLIRYYDSVPIVLIDAKIQRVMMNNFDIQCKSMVEKYRQTKPDVPKLVRNTTVANWNNSVKVYAAQVFGARKATLEYLLRPNDEVVSPHPHLVMDHPYSAAAGSIQGDQTLRLSLKQPL